MNSINRCLFLLFILVSFNSFSQEEKSYTIYKTDESISLDGMLDEQVWKTSQKATKFHQLFPTDTVMAISESEIMLTYDDEYIYFAAKMYNQSNNRKYVTPSLRRDYRGPSIDGISFVFDTFGDQTNAFQFGINAYGVQREGLVSNGGYRSNDFALTWDNKWEAVAVQYDGYWVAEGAIPFKTLRFKEGSPEWNVNFYRIDSESEERSTWTFVPRNFQIYSLAYTSKLIWDQPLKKPGSNISLIPYVAGSSGVDKEVEPDPAKHNNISAGFDAKLGIGPSLNLDLTLNPDFSQVEVDEQVTNLNRFEISFPEKRQFFIENADLFGSFGHPMLANPFFSRRIGLAIDSSTNQNVQNKIHYGARLSGKINNDWRVGLLNIQAAADTSINLASTNYTVAAVQRKVFARSNIGAILVNQQTLKNEEGDYTTSPETYNRILGLDYVLSSADNKWNGKIFYHKSFDEDNTDKQYSFASWLLYRSQTWEFDFAAVKIGENFEARTGYMPRQGIFRINPAVGYNIYPKSGGINSHNLTLETEQFWSQQVRTDRDFKLTYKMSKSNTANLEAQLVQSTINLINPFDPTRVGGEELPAGTGYMFHYFSAQYRTNSRRSLVGTLMASAGTFFNGERYNISTILDYRAQPYAAIKLNANFNRIVLPAPYNTANLFLIGPRIDLTFSKSVFFTTFVQYNSQIDNVNLNARFQWRFKPVSDLFIVYTNNYGTEDQFGQFSMLEKNRALTVKLTYWLNM